MVWFKILLWFWLRLRYNETTTKSKCIDFEIVVHSMKVLEWIR